MPVTFRVNLNFSKRKRNKFSLFFFLRKIHYNHLHRKSVFSPCSGRNGNILTPANFRDILGYFGDIWSIFFDIFSDIVRYQKAANVSLPSSRRYAVVIIIIQD